MAAEIDRHHASLAGVKDYLVSRGITRETADRFKLGFDGKRLTIPYLTPAGAWTIKRRCIADHDCKQSDCQKYLNEPGADLHLFNAQTLLDAQNVIVTEGELDAVVAEQYGIRAVGYPGATQWRGHAYWRHCFESCDEVVVVADGDEPGTRSAAVVVESLRDAVIHGDVRVVQMPSGHDTSSFIQVFGESVFLAEIGWL